jgi:hypothetical protein
VKLLGQPESFKMCSDAAKVHTHTHTHTHKTLTRTSNDRCCCVVSVEYVCTYTYLCQGWKNLRLGLRCVAAWISNDCNSEVGMMCCTHTAMCTATNSIVRYHQSTTSASTQCTEGLLILLKSDSTEHLSLSLTHTHTHTKHTHTHTHNTHTHTNTHTQNTHNTITNTQQQNRSHSQWKARCYQTVRSSSGLRKRL